MTRCTYGIASSAFHCTRAVEEIGDSCADKELGHSFKTDFYVDDYLSGAISIREARTKITKVCDELQKYGVELRKWASSHHELTTELPVELRENVDIAKVMHEDYKIKTLGISWKPNKDKFYFNTDFAERNKLTKRELLSITARLFDPIGWFGPIEIRFKILLQKSWVLGISWDETLPSEIQEQWNQIKTDLKCLRDFSLNRCIVPPTKIQTVAFPTWSILEFCQTYSGSRNSFHRHGEAQESQPFIWCNRGRHNICKTENDKGTSDRLLCNWVSHTGSSKRAVKTK